MKTLEPGLFKPHISWAERTLKEHESRPDRYKCVCARTHTCACTHVHGEVGWRWGLGHFWNRKFETWLQRWLRWSRALWGAAQTHLHGGCSWRRPAGCDTLPSLQELQGSIFPSTPSDPQTNFLNQVKGKLYQVKAMEAETRAWKSTQDLRAPK